MIKSKQDTPVKEVEKKLMELEAELKAVTGRLAKALADYQNLEKRMGSEVERNVDKVKEELIKDWLEIYEAVEKMAEFYQHDVGVKAIISKFKEILKKWGVEEVRVKRGDKFDPKIAECIEIGKGEKDKIIEVVRKGYYLSGKLIRPVLVKVGNGKDTKLGNKEVKNG